MINIDITDRAPKYRQISEQIKKSIASRQLLPGQRMPTVRALAQNLRINPATVARAYAELRQKGVLEIKHKAGTSVSGVLNNPQKLLSRQKRLESTVRNLLLETLNQGYNPQELEAVFAQRLVQWCVRRETSISAVIKATADTRR